MLGRKSIKRKGWNELDISELSHIYIYIYMCVYMCAYVLRRERKMGSITEATATRPHVVCVPQPLQSHIYSNARASKTPPP